VTSSGWSGELWLAKDFALIDGAAGATSMHAHYAHQVLLSPGGDVTVECDGETVRGARVLIPSMQRHRIVDAPARLFTLYAEPLAMSADALLDAARHGAPSLDALAEALAQRRRPLPDDPRVARALALLDAPSPDSLSAHTLATAAHVSVSQLERLFGSRVGLPIRQLVRWRRLCVALERALGGQTLTAAAHEAGFADSAHFSRTMRALFGVRADASLRAMRIRSLR
jgi:AraC-like DNA-binding protein